MKKRIVIPTFIIILFLILLIVLKNYDNALTLKASVSDSDKKIVSIMGDSISTFRGTSYRGSNIDGGYYPRWIGLNHDSPDIPNDILDVNDTWWMRTINTLGFKLGVDAAWSGSTIEQDSSNPSDSYFYVDSRVNSLDINGTPDYIFIFGGTNDMRMFSNDTDLSRLKSFIGETNSTSTKTLCGAYNTLFSKLKTRYPNAKIISILPMQKSSITNEAYSLYHTAFVNVFNKNSIPWVDLSTISDLHVPYGISESDLDKTYFIDRVHPNKKGAKLISDAVVSAFNKKTTVNFYKNNGSDNPMITKTYKFGNFNQKFNDNGWTVKTGTCLYNWNTKADGTSNSYNTNSNVYDIWIQNNNTVNLYAQWGLCKMSIMYNANGGVIHDNSSNKVGSSGSYVTIDGSKIAYTLKYGESLPTSGLANYNNSDYIMITRDNYVTVTGKEWKDKNGKEYSQTKQYKASDFSSVCDVSKKSCDLVLYVNWKKVASNPKSCNDLTYNGSSQTLISSGVGHSFINNTRTDAGSQVVTAKLNSGYAWSNYTDANKTIECTIKKYSLSNASVPSIPSQTYTGSAITPKITVTALNKTLTLNTDYTVSYKNNTNVGTATITITGKGNYTGTKTLTFTISKKSITVPTVSNKTYSGSEQTISAKTGYTLTGTVKATNVGTYTATAKLSDKTNTKWSDGTTTDKTITWKIVAYDICNASVSSVSSQTYTGSAIKPPITVTALNKTLVLSTDYTVAYKDNTNAGTATITITGKGNYKGTKALTFTISKKSITVPTYSNKTYNKTEQTISAKTGFTLTGTVKATNAGTYTATAKLSDKTNTMWSDKTTTDKTITWKIVPISLTIPTCSSKTYNGKEQTLFSAKDGTNGYKNNVLKGKDAGNYDATLSLVNTNYIWSDNTKTNKTITCKISKANMSSATFNTIDDQTYTGSAITPEVIVKIGTYTLLKGTDYTVSYSNNTNPGNATITITGKNSVTGSKVLEFTIEEAAVENTVRTKDSNYVVIRSKKIFVKLKKSENNISKSGLLNKLTITGTYDVRDKDNKVIGDSITITTSSKIHFSDKDYVIMILGDVDKDGSITMSDLYEVYRHIKKTSTLSGNKFDAADYIQDSSVNMADLYEIYKKIKKVN